MMIRYAALALALTAAPVAAQTYGAITPDDLGNGILTDVEPDCILFAGDADNDVFIFFDDTSDQIVGSVPGAITQIGASAAELTAATGLTLDRCRDAAFAPDTFDAYFVLSDADNTDVVVRLDGDAELTLLTDPSNATDAGDGTSGIAVSADNQTLYLARSEFNGAPEDGVYTLDTTTPGQTPAALEINADYDLNGIALDAAGDLYVASSEFGSGAFQNVVVKILADGSAAPAVILEPCAGAAPIFVNCTDGGIEDLAVAADPAGASGELLFLANNAFSSPDGETVGVFGLDGSGGDIVFTQAGLIAGTDATEYTTAGNNGYLAVAGDRVFLAGSSAFGGTPGLYVVDGAFPVTGESTPVAVFELSVAPNPAAGAARVRVTAERAGALSVDVVDLLGRRVATLFEGTAAAGQTVAATADGLAPGVYLVRARSAVGVATERLTVAR